MHWYRRKLFPALCARVMQAKSLREIRARVVGRATGDVLELAMGAGANLPFYDSAAVRTIVGIEPDDVLRAAAAATAAAIPIPVELRAESAESTTLPPQFFDTAVVTWGLCSIPRVDLALREVRRVLKDDGVLLFAEHGLAPGALTRWWQRSLTPLWRFCAGGCRLDLPVRSTIEAAGFEIVTIRVGFLAGPKPMTWISEGVARKRVPRAEQKPEIPFQSSSARCSAARSRCVSWKSNSPNASSCSTVGNSPV